VIFKEFDLGGFATQEKKFSKQFLPRNAGTVGRIGCLHGGQ
jgi:hypothetical protein